MLKEHHNLVTPKSDCLKVGEYQVDIPRREVAAPPDGVPRRITQKTMQVLLMLVGYHGKVVSREALLEWVWPDTMPTDDVVTQAIAQLRKAFADDRDAPQYIETIAKSGYRLLAPVAWIEPDAGHAAIAESDPRNFSAKRARKGSFALGVLLVSMLVAVTAIVLTRRSSSEDAGALHESTAGTQVAQLLDYRTITSRPGRETSPSLSPDGALVAYVETPSGTEDTAIMLQATGQVPPRQLSHPESGSSDALPTWSRDGRSIAFVRVDADGDDCRIMVLPTSGGTERSLGRCYAGMASQFDWTPDGGGLLMGGMKRPEDPSSPLRLLDFATGEWRTLSYPIADGDIDIDPHYSPDGRWIVFKRNLSLADLWKMPAAGGAPERLTHLKGDIRGWDWMPDGSALILSYFHGTRDLYRYRMADGRIDKLTDAGMIERPDVAARAESVVFQLDLGKSGIFRYAVDDHIRAVHGEPERLFAASGSDLLPSVSPDGKRLAYVSKRTLKNALWLGDVDQPESLRPVDGIVPIARHAPVWSEAGDRLLVIAYGPESPQLHEVSMESSRARALPVPEGTPIYAAYVEDPNRLLVGVDRGGGKVQLVLYDTTHLPWRAEASIEGVTFAHYAVDSGRTFFTHISQPGLWSVDAQLTDVVTVDAEFPSLEEYKRWTLVRGVPHYLVWRADCANYWTVRPRASDSSGRCLEPAHIAIGAPSVSRDGRLVYLAMPTEDNTDVGWASLADVEVVGTASTPANRPELVRKQY